MRSLDGVLKHHIIIHDAGHDNLEPMNFQVKSPGDKPGVYPIARRGKELKYLSFTIIQLGGTLDQHTFESGDEELSLDFYSGPVRVAVEGPSGHWSADIPSRT